MIYIFLGFIAGLLGAVTGLGGGIIIIPCLALLFHIGIHKAIGISLIAIAVNTSFSSISYAKKGLTDFTLGLFLEQSAVLGAISGALLSGYLNARWLEFIFSMVLLFAAFQMAFSLNIPLEEIKIRSLAPLYKIENTFLGQILSFFAGLFSGMLGIGGGIFKIPVMCLIMKVPVKVAVATSSFMIFITSVSSGWIFYLRKDLYLELAVLISLGVMFGSLTGSRIGLTIKSKWQSKLIALLLALAAIRMLSGIK